MKKLFALILSTALAFGPALAYASPGTIIKGDVLDGFENILVNPSVERSSCTNGWTVAPTSACDGTNLAPGQGRQSVQLTLSTSSGALFYQDVTPIHQFGSTNMEAGLWVKTSTSGLQVCPRSGGTVLTAQCVSVPATGTWQAVSANMIGPSSGTVGVALYAPNSIASGTVNVDGGYLGRARNLSQVSQAQLLGTVTISGCAGAWNTTSTTYTDFTAASGCSYAVTGQAQAPATNIPAIKFASIPPGELMIQFDGNIVQSTTGQGGYVQFWDGTNSAREAPEFFSGAGSIGITSASQSITYTSPQSNVTISLRGKTSSGGTTTVHSDNGQTSVIKVYYYPSQSQLAVRADQTPASWSGTTTLTGSTTSTSLADFGSVSGSVTQTASRNMTCSAAASLVGVTCNLPRLGNYLACFAGLVSNTVSGNFTKSALFDGSNVEITGFQNANIPTSGGAIPIGACATYTATTSSVTFKLMGLVGANTGNAFLNSFSIVGLDAPMPAPYLVGSVTSSSQGQERVERATVQCGSSSSITSQSGSWLSSVGNLASGTCAFTAATGEWSASPVCTANVQGTSTAQGFALLTNATSATAFTVACNVGGTACTGTFGINIICQGPR